MRKEKHDSAFQQTDNRILDLSSIHQHFLVSVLINTGPKDLKPLAYLTTLKSTELI
jgi:hypothetical protein